jgi:hypothetical protein
MRKTRQWFNSARKRLLARTPRSRDIARRFGTGLAQRWVLFVRAIRSSIHRICNASWWLQRWLREKFLDHPVWLALPILVLGLIITIVLYGAMPELREGFWPGVFVEFNGTLIDVAVVSVLMALFTRRIEKRQEDRRQQEIIGDYKKWNSDEGRSRTAGAIRRLNSNGINSIDFGGIELSDFSFRQHDIRTIRGVQVL